MAYGDDVTIFKLKLAEHLIRRTVDSFVTVLLNGFQRNRCYISFHHFPLPALHHTIKLGVDDFPTFDGNNALQFFASGNASPIFEFAPGSGIGNSSTLGGYFQIQDDPSNPGNSGLAIFQNISVVTIPEIQMLVAIVKPNTLEQVRNN